MTAQRVWNQRVAESNQVDIRPVAEGRRGMTAGKLMLYPSASMVNDAIRAIPDGQTVTPKELRATLAQQFDVTYTCPVTTTMMLRIVAEAANESRDLGETDIAPVWRVLAKGGSGLRKLTFDPEWILEKRDREIALH